MSISFTPEQQIILVNQLRVLSALNYENNSKYYQDMAYGIQQGCFGIIPYTNDFQCEKPIEEHVYTEVIGIFKTYRWLIDNGVVSKFPGFDYNNDEDHVTFANLLFKNNRFREFAVLDDEVTNSHGDSNIENYRELLEFIKDKYNSNLDGVYPSDFCNALDESGIRLINRIVV